jgi:2-polyprenyl-3-methyl-5-hydroxy-6-metoxy-1,4-benzoquinol methylase
MSREVRQPDWQQTQNLSYLELLQRRLQEPPLTWVTQFVELINQEIASGLFGELKAVSINDYGCNVGHFFRGIKDILRNVTYRGFDVSETYLEVARRHFGTENFRLLDISSFSTDEQLPRSNIAVISATLEHIEDHQSAIRNIFSHTDQLVLLRTFVGNTSLAEWCRTIGAERDYLIKQFTIDELMSVPSEFCYCVREELDRSTEGKAKLVCNAESILRRQSILVYRALGRTWR